MAKNRIYIPTFISSVNYAPARVLPHIYFYNGMKACETYYIQGYGNTTGSVISREIDAFPYFDNYEGQDPTSGSRSLLFFNEPAVYGVTPTGSLYTNYWETYINLLYNPRTRLFNCEGIIPLADYFKMELNDIVEWRGNYYHLRAINDYNLKNGECKLQLLGPILGDILPNILPAIACDFTFDFGCPAPTTTRPPGTTTSTTTIAPTTTTTTFVGPTTSTTTTLECRDCYSTRWRCNKASSDCNPVYYNCNGGVETGYIPRGASNTFCILDGYNGMIDSDGASLTYNFGNCGYGPSGCITTTTTTTTAAPTTTLAPTTTTTTSASCQTCTDYSVQVIGGSGNRGTVYYTDCITNQLRSFQITSQTYRRFVGKNPYYSRNSGTWIGPNSQGDATMLAASASSCSPLNYTTCSLYPYTGSQSGGTFVVFYYSYVDASGSYVAIDDDTYGGTARVMQQGCYAAAAFPIWSTNQYSGSCVVHPQCIPTTTTLAPTTTTTLAPTTTTTTVANCSTYQITNSSPSFAGQVSYVPCGYSGYREIFVPQSSTITLCVQSGQIQNVAGYASSSLTDLGTPCTASLEDCISYTITNSGASTYTYSGKNCSNCANQLYNINGGVTVTRCFVSGTFSTSYPAFVTATAGAICNVSGSGCPI